MEISEATKGIGLRGKLNKVVLAYSGGLDTSVIVPWLRYVSCYMFCSPCFMVWNIPLFMFLLYKYSGFFSFRLVCLEYN